MVGGVADFARTLGAARNGEEWALAALWRSHQRPLLSWLATMVGGAADDVASETWIDVARGLGRFSGDEGAFRSWLFTIARRRAVDHLRRQGRRLETAVSDRHLAARPAPTDVAEQAQSSLALRQALGVVDRLSPDQREVILLCVLGGLRPAQVAPVLGKTEGAVRVLQHRALRRLAQLLPRPVAEEV
ncbi:MAG TPA: sigma-70 family RNA polymerase sigma factor [Acidimicrobiales bacterium]|nr:sigma-70 family RNA polymerase sigma factor [Acidimicrobiales bacterium]